MEQGGKKIAHVCTVQIEITKFVLLLILQEQASIGCHLPICTVSQTKLEVGIPLLDKWPKKNEEELLAS